MATGTNHRGSRALASCALLTAAALGGVATIATATTHRPSAHTIVAKGVFGRRYCELLIVRKTSSGLAADVYNTYGLNNCPERAWQAIDTTAVAHATHALAVVRNGPRFWLMSEIEKVQQGPELIKNLGGVRMIKEATLALSDLSTAPYKVHHVNRQTTWIYNAGQTVYELRAPNGSRWVMQSLSQQIDATLSRGELRTLASKLKLPTGWSYSARRLSKRLKVVTVRTSAQVLQDSLGDTYSRL